MTLPPHCLPACPTACPTATPFARVFVKYNPSGGTDVSYTLNAGVPFRNGMTFQLESGRAGVPGADDWAPVGAPVHDLLTLRDEARRPTGKVDRPYYRIRLTTPDGEVRYSDPVGREGTLSPLQWRLAHAALRAERVYMQAGDGQLVYVMKRREAGDRCPRCTDPQTGDVREPGCPVCFGTGYTCGYFFPLDCAWADVSPKSYHTEIKEGQGTKKDVTVRARIAGFLMLDEGDVVVTAATDDRYYVHSVQNLVEFVGVAVVRMVELRLLAGSDPIYLIKLPN